MTDWMFERSKGDELIVELAWFMRDIAEKQLGPVNWTAIATELYENGYILDEQEIEDEQDI